MSSDEEQVRLANEGFYRAFESLDLARMEAAWCHEGAVSCVHPGWPLAAGWSEVLESWRTIFKNTDRIRFRVSDERIDVRGELAWVVCTEWLRTESAIGRGEGAVVATNVFRRESGPGGAAWRLAHHHGSPFVPHPEELRRLPEGGGGVEVVSGGSAGGGVDDDRPSRPFRPNPKKGPLN